MPYKCINKMCIRDRAWYVQSQVKTMLTLFTNYKGTVHHEYAPIRQTITKEYYIGMLCHLKDALHRKKPRFQTLARWKSGKLHHDNALITCVTAFS